MNRSFQIKSIQQTAVDLAPIGKTPAIGGQEPDTDDEGKFLTIKYQKN